MRVVGQVTFDVLPDDVFLDIFDFYMHQARRCSSKGIEAWHTLVHVCRHWRNIVFVSPLRLNLQLLCTASTPVRETRCLASLDNLRMGPRFNIGLG